jgi:hypothetical protein
MISFIIVDHLYFAVSAVIEGTLCALAACEDVAGRVKATSEGQVQKQPF